MPTMLSLYVSRGISDSSDGMKDRQIGKLLGMSPAICHHTLFRLS